jgi:hypothetical protein
MHFIIDFIVLCTQGRIKRGSSRGSSPGALSSTQVKEAQTILSRYKIFIIPKLVVLYTY